MDAQGVPLTEETLELCRRSDAVLLGAVGGPRWDHLPPGERPESGLLRLRKELRLYANLRPVTWHPSLLDTSPLKPELLRGVDLLFVRELTGGIYFGQKRSYADRASDLCEYTVEEIERVVRLAGQLAQRRRRKLTSIDKANVLQTSRLWRETTRHIIESEFPDLELEHLLVDAAAMHLVRRPAEFDVIVTENMFGDILSDEASVLAGSMGMLPSASLGSGRQGLYEPVHGSAPDIAGQGIANPYAAILSAAMLLRHSLGREHEAKRVEKAVFDAISGGALTADIAGAGIEPCSTAAAGDAVLRALAA
jgi:3-isopropylmalate dehydrogenase